MTDAKTKSDRKAENRATLAFLSARFPAAFPPEPGAPRRPLKLRIDRDIRERAPDLSVRRLKTALGWWTSSADYQRALAEAGAERIDLDGAMVEPVSEDHRAAAAARTGWHEHNKARLQEAQKAAAKDTRGEVDAEANRDKPRLSGHEVAVSAPPGREAASRSRAGLTRSSAKRRGTSEARVP